MAAIRGIADTNSTDNDTQTEDIQTECAEYVEVQTEDAEIINVVDDSVPISVIISSGTTEIMSIADIIDVSDSKTEDVVNDFRSASDVLTGTTPANITASSVFGNITLTGMSSDPVSNNLTRLENVIVSSIVSRMSNTHTLIITTKMHEMSHIPDHCIISFSFTPRHTSNLSYMLKVECVKMSQFREIIGRVCMSCHNVYIYCSTSHECTFVGDMLCNRFPVIRDINAFLMESGGEPERIALMTSLCQNIRDIKLAGISALSLVSICLQNNILINIILRCTAHGIGEHPQITGIWIFGNSHSIHEVVRAYFVGEKFPTQKIICTFENSKDSRTITDALKYSILKGRLPAESANCILATCRHAKLYVYCKSDINPHYLMLWNKKRAPVNYEITGVHHYECRKSYELGALLSFMSKTNHVSEINTIKMVINIIFNTLVSPGQLTVLSSYINDYLAERKITEQYWSHR